MYSAGAVTVMGGVMFDPVELRQFANWKNISTVWLVVGFRVWPWLYQAEYGWVGVSG